MIHLWWHTEAEDINLGEAYVDVLPPVGSLIAYTAAPVRLDEPRPAGWRVAFVQVYPAMPGSRAVHHPDGQYGIYNVFVEPAEGPFHP